MHHVALAWRNRRGSGFATRTIMRTNLWWCLVVVGCGAPSTPGANPHDMSVAGHEGMASQEDSNAAAHKAKFDPNAGTSKERCSHLRAPGDGTVDGACWTSITNPTAEHLEQAKQHQKMAADHRAASAALRTAEVKACAGISELDRDMSPFAHTEDISSVEPLNVTSSGKVQFTRSVGAVVTFRAVPAMTAQWLQRTIDCHVARNAALGHQVPEMAYCPLVPMGVTATVKPTQDGFAVELRSEDADVVQEIRRRTLLLTKR
jgi:hypothetical protein